MHNMKLVQEENWTHNMNSAYVMFPRL